MCIRMYEGIVAYGFSVHLFVTLCVCVYVYKKGYYHNLLHVCLKKFLVK